MTTQEEIVDINEKITQTEVESELLKFAIDIASWTKREIKVPDDEPFDAAGRYARIIIQIVRSR